MGYKTNRHSVPPKARSSASKQTDKAIIKQPATRKKHQQWSKDRSERVRDALNRDADLLYNVLENSKALMPSSVLQTDSVGSLAESMQGLGR